MSLWYQVGRIQVTAFQSLDGKQNHVLRPVVSPINKSPVIDLESSLSSTEHSLTNSGSTRAECLEHDTGDSKAAAGASKVYLPILILQSLYSLFSVCL